MSYIPLFLDLGVKRASSVVESTSVYTYVGCAPVNRSCEEFTTLVLDIAFTKASHTSFEVVVEGSNTENASTWYAYSIGSFSTPTENVEKDVFSFVASKYGTTDTVSVPVQINHKYVRFGVKGTGTLTSSAVAVSAALIRK